MAALKDMWLAGQLEGKHSAQLIGLAGDGNIHTPATSTDLRECLHVMSLETLQRFARECLGDKNSPYSGFFLQDIINELGLRLDFEVTFGRYQGSSKHPAPDGIWVSPSWGFVVEVKTTDAYRIKLDTIARYRRVSTERGELPVSESSMLIIVGREDTGELEAQVRGSKHAWDMRLIGVDALFKLAFLHRDSVEQEAVLDKIRAVLRPQEYTRVDSLLDVVFETAKAVNDDDLRGDEPVIAEQVQSTSVASEIIRPSQENKDELRQAAVAAIEVRERKQFKKVRRSLYESVDGTVRFSVAISKNYGTSEQGSFWYAFHPAQKRFVEAVNSGFAVFGCEGLNAAVALPLQVLFAHLNELSQTVTTERSYWHVFIKTNGDRFILETKSRYNDLDVSSYALRTKYLPGSTDAA
jgi:hypothetical protein